MIAYVSRKKVNAPLTHHTGDHVRGAPIMRGTPRIHGTIYSIFLVINMTVNIALGADQRVRSRSSRTKKHGVRTPRRVD
jgi:hypothetical protein